MKEVDSSNKLKELINVKQKEFQMTNDRRNRESGNLTNVKRVLEKLSCQQCSQFKFNLNLTFTFSAFSTFFINIFTFHLTFCATTFLPLAPSLPFRLLPLSLFLFTEKKKLRNWKINFKSQLFVQQIQPLTHRRAWLACSLDLF